jgi:hypothetical protein
MRPGVFWLSECTPNWIVHGLQVSGGQVRAGKRSKRKLFRMYPNNSCGSFTTTDGIQGNDRKVRRAGLRRCLADVRYLVKRTSPVIAVYGS